MDKRYRLLVVLENYHGDWMIASGISNFQSKAPRRLRLIVDHHEQTQQIIKKWKPDVLIVHGNHARQISSKLPTVFIYGERTGKPRFNVTLDNLEIGKTAAEYFIDRAFRNFAFITGRQSMPFSALRLKGFQHTLEGHGFAPLVFDDLCMSGLNPIQTTDQSMEHLQQWLKKAPKPLAVFAHDDTHGLHSLEACADIGLKVPEEVAVLGTDNHPILCSFPAPQLSSIELPMRQIGQTAARIAEGILFEENKEPENIAFAPLKTVTRGSSDIIATVRPELKRAIRYISANIAEPLQPKDVVEHTFVSRSKLQRGFKVELNRTILEEIHRQKLERAKELLEQTPLAVYEIGEKCGMPSSPQFISFFTQKTGTSPLKYRGTYHKKTFVE
ncbi:MAG: substrate-binding domain-containing protein [Verrucomicrobiota bacterium]|nr:substrate-binding domain-containing protein [Verrucomicrobiota bacterium]